MFLLKSQGMLAPKSRVKFCNRLEGKFKHHKNKIDLDVDGIGKVSLVRFTEMDKPKDLLNKMQGNWDAYACEIGKGSSILNVELDKNRVIYSNYGNNHNLNYNPQYQGNRCAS